MDTLSTYIFALEEGKALIRVPEDADPREVEEMIRIATARGCKRISLVVVGREPRVLDRLRPVIKGCIVPTLGLWIASSEEEASALEDEDLGELFA